MSTPAPVRVGPLAELALNRAIMKSLREQLTDAQAIVNRRAAEAYADGLHRGRAAWPIGLLIGAAIGGILTAFSFALFS